MFRLIKTSELNHCHSKRDSWKNTSMTPTRSKRKKCSDKERVKKCVCMCVRERERMDAEILE